MDTPARTLGIDVGEVRIGVARSDALGWTAQPLEAVAVHRDGRHFRELRERVERDDIRRVVVGLPLMLSGEEGEAAVAARAFAAKLGQAIGSDIEIVFWDERLSTAQVEREMIAQGVRRARRKQRIDAAAAAVILQSYLDARGSG